MFFHDMNMLERVFWLKRIKGSGNPMHEATSTSGSFVTDVVAPLKKLLLNLSPIQSGSGTPSPSNVRPISGHTEVDTEVCGVNLLPSDAFAFDGYIEAGSGHVASADATRKEKVTDYFEIMSGKALCFSVKVANAEEKWIGIGIYDADKKFIKRVGGSKGSAESISQVLSASDTASAKYIRISFRTYDIAEDAQLELGSTATSYEPYIAPTSYTTPLGRTVYGDTLDVVSGELVVDRAIITFDGTETWVKSSSGNVYYCTTDSTVFPYGKDHASYNISDKYAFKGFTPGGYNSFLNDGEYLLYEWGGSSSVIREIAFKNESITSLEDWKASLQSNPIQIVYELATPQTYQLDPQQINSLVGQNTIITEDGVEVDEIVYMTRLVGSPLLGSPQTEEPTEETDEPIEETEEPEGE